MKTVYVCRGAAGSGKSYLAEKLYNQDQSNSTICSADHYFIKDGVYTFDRNKLGSAHKYCQNKAYDACLAGVANVIIDNTNITKKEWKTYVGIAEEFGYEVRFVIPDTPWAFNAEECAKRNQHGVPLETIQNMLQRWEESPNDLRYSFPA